MAITYFTLGELRALPDMNNTTRYTDARCTAVGEYVESVIDGVCGTSFAARTVTETVDGSGDDELRLSRPFVQSITSVTVNGAPLTGYTYTFRAGLLKRRATGTYSDVQWDTGSQNITVVYTSGFSATAPADIKEAALQATRYRLIGTDSKSNISDRATSITNEFGNVQLSTSSADGRPFGLPDVDAVVMRWAKLNVFGYA